MQKLTSIQDAPTFEIWCSARGFDDPNLMRDDTLQAVCDAYVLEISRGYKSEIYPPDVDCNYYRLSIVADTQTVDLINWDGIYKTHVIRSI